MPYSGHIVKTGLLPLSEILENSGYGNMFLLLFIYKLRKILTFANTNLSFNSFSLHHLEIIRANTSKITVKDHIIFFKDASMIYKSAKFSYFIWSFALIMLISSIFSIFLLSIWLLQIIYHYWLLCRIYTSILYRDTIVFFLERNKKHETFTSHRSKQSPSHNFFEKCTVFSGVLPAPKYSQQRVNLTNICCFDNRYPASVYTSCVPAHTPPICEPLTTLQLCRTYCVLELGIAI